jgi:putative acetyltransferase
MDVEIRAATVEDVQSIVSFFKECVLMVSQDYYSQGQLEAWASASENISRWLNKIETQFFLIAFNNRMLVGFGSLEGKDTIDLLYVHKSFQRSGVASLLFNRLQQRAQQLRASVSKADVSKGARGFFEHKGFHVVTNQINKIHDIDLENHRMIKEL